MNYSGSSSFSRFTMYSHHILIFLQGIYSTEILMENILQQAVFKFPKKIVNILNFCLTIGILYFNMLSVVNI